MCGEKYRACKVPSLLWGSPPRVRGKVVSASSNKVHVGITPACAGKSQPERLAAVGQQDHPRVCGEKRRTHQCPAASSGSPPRVRGKAVGYRIDTIEEGITPACAGKRQYQLPGGHGQKDHPRVCGEKYQSMAHRVRVTGSPPRVRGKDSIKWQWKTGLGDHPRVCGEK